RFLPRMVSGAGRARLPPSRSSRLGGSLALPAPLVDVRDAPGRPELQVGRHLERRAPLRTLNLAAADTGHADAQLLDRAADLALDRLQIRLEGAAADAGDLATDAAQVLRLAAPGVVIAENRLLAAHVTLHAHENGLPIGWYVSRKEFTIAGPPALTRRPSGPLAFRPGD